MTAERSRPRPRRGGERRWNRESDARRDLHALVLRCGVRDGRGGGREDEGGEQHGGVLRGEGRGCGAAGEGSDFHPVLFISSFAPPRPFAPRKLSGSVTPAIRSNFGETCSSASKLALVEPCEPCGRRRWPAARAAGRCAWRCGGAGYARTHLEVR